MNTPPPLSRSDACFYISGTVTVHPDAAIATGVLLQADPGSQLIIEAGACIGAGTVLHAYQGTLVIARDAVLGRQVLIVGNGRVGQQACIGSCSTLMFEIDVANQQLVLPNSLIGDTSRRPLVAGDTLEGESAEELNGQSASQSSGTQAGHPPTADAGTGAEKHPLKENASDASGFDAPNGVVPNGTVSNGSASLSCVYGRASVERLIQVMFPARQSMSALGTSPETTGLANGPEARSTPPP